MDRRWKAQYAVVELHDTAVIRDRGSVVRSKPSVKAAISGIGPQQPIMEHMAAPQPTPYSSSLYVG